MRKITIITIYFLTIFISSAKYSFAYSSNNLSSKLMALLTQFYDVLLFILIPTISIFLILKIQKFAKTSPAEVNLIKKQKKSIYINIAFIIFFTLISITSISIKLYLAAKINNNTNYSYNTTNIAPDLTTEGLTITPIKILKEFSGTNWVYCPIGDANDPSVQEVKKIFLENSKISEKYFNTHFFFVCGNKRSPSDKEANYIFKIADYSTAINLRYSTDNEYVKMFTLNHEIKDLLPSQTAIEKLVQCLGSRPEGAISATFLLPDNGLYLTGSSNRSWAKINLETGECNKMGVPSFE